MANIADDLFEVAKELAEFKPSTKVVSEMATLAREAVEMGRAWSGSSLGYHSKVYTNDLRPPIGHTRFSVEWGLMDAFSNRTQGYRIFDPEDVRREVLDRAGNPNLKAAQKFIKDAGERINKAKDTVNSLFALDGTKSQDDFTKAKLNELRDLELPDESEILQSIVPTGRTISRDMEAMSNGRHPGAHHRLRVLALLFEDARGRLGIAAKLCEGLGSHLVRKRRSSRRIDVVSYRAEARQVGKHVFIGHGQSPLWRDLRDFIRDRLGLDYDEFNRVAVAGKSNKERLTEMLDAAEIALIVMTGEDEMNSGRTQPRMNVIHEAGLFQGRLGFGRAIILLEEGCEDFSNIDGLGQIRFPKGNIKQVFEEIRRVLEREGIISGGKPS